MKILFTGFEPFSNHKENSSWVVAEKVTTLGVAGVELILELMPVSFMRVSAALRNAVEKHSPDVIVMLGQSANIDYVKLERIAINMMDSAKPDNDGYIPDEVPIFTDGAAALFTNTDIKALHKAVEEQGIVARVSNSAGLYVCNRLYYEALLLCKENPEMRALFVHLPLYAGHTSAIEGKPVMPLDDMVKAVRVIISNMMQKEELSNIQ